MPSTKKLVTYRNKQFLGTRRAKPRVRALNSAVREQIEADHDLIQALIRDADDRRDMLLSMKGSIGPFAVWTDFDQDIHLAKFMPKDLPQWKNIGECLKFHLLFLVAVELGGFSFTVRIRPDLQIKWLAEGRKPMDRITRELRKVLQNHGLGDLAYCYVVEGRTRQGSGITQLHLHGFLLAQDRLIATRFKMAMEQAVAIHPKGRAAAGILMKSGPEVDIRDSYDPVDKSERGRGRWVSYITKNVSRWDGRLPGKRTFMSRGATQTTREFWALLRTDPFE